MRHAAGGRIAAGLFVMLAAPDSALAQRTTENAVTSADDAFGTSIGLAILIWHEIHRLFGL